MSVCAQHANLCSVQSTLLSRRFAVVVVWRRRFRRYCIRSVAASSLRFVCQMRQDRRAEQLVRFSRFSRFPASLFSDMFSDVAGVAFVGLR